MSAGPEDQDPTTPPPGSAPASQARSKPKSGGRGRRTWQGTLLSCKDCAQADLLSEGLCDPEVACVHDRRPALIEAFFRRAPAEADGFLDHPWFLVRAKAVRRASLFHLLPLMRDPDPEVRWAVTQRLPQGKLRRMRDDPDPKVRAGVAGRLEGGDLASLVSDPDYTVRLVVARRLPPAMLALVIRDPDPEVRRVVARRIPADWLHTMIWDTSPEVRMDVADRLEPAQLAPLVNDPDLRVRFKVAERGDPAHLPLLINDPEEPVRSLARDRLAQAAEVIPLTPPQRGSAPGFGARSRALDPASSPPSPPSMR